MFGFIWVLFKLFTHATISIHHSSIDKVKKAKILEIPGFEPGAFRMQSGRATTALYPRQW
jgi:hypothetical protein